MLKHRAFSLVELSIVLIIIGLLVAGASAGSKLVHNTKLQTLTTEITNLRQSVLTFVMTYDSLPGDMAEAFDFFGVVNSCIDANVNSVATGCNGDNDGKIEWRRESYRALQHLMSAELIAGTFNGTSDVLKSTVFLDGEYHPPLQCSNTNEADMGTNCSMFGAPYLANGALLLPRDQYKIDKKLDDGLPKSGNIRFRTIGEVNTATCGDNTVGYRKNLTVAGCNIVFAVGDIY